MDSYSGSSSAGDTQKTGYEKARAVGRVIMAFGVVALISAAYFTTARGKAVSGNLPAEGGVLGPIEVARDNTVLLISVRQPFSDDGWSFIEGEVLDHEQEYLFGFGEELWRESGYDGGYWSETDDTFDLKVTIPKKGTYYLGFTTESAAGMGSVAAYGNTAAMGAKSVVGNLYVEVEPKQGSAVLFFITGIVGLILGFAVSRIAASGANMQGLGRMGES